MLSVIGLVAAGVWVGQGQILDLARANLVLNGAIGVVFLVGVLACMWQVVQLIASVRWIEGFAAGRPGTDAADAPRLLAPLAALLSGRQSRMAISSTSQRSILDSVATRIDEARDITRYIVNLLILMGLLGTFYGLATTVPAVVDTIRALAPQEGETGVQVFDKLMGGLEAQLGGMGTAFSSSLLGLAGSLVVGLLELFAGHGQNRFYRELEEWTSTITRLGLAGDGGEATGDAGAVAGALADYTARVETQMEAMLALVARGEAARALADERVVKLAGAIERLAQRLETDAPASALLLRIADAQETAAAALTGQASEGGPDAESRMRLRSIDVQLLRILEELSAGRQEAVADLRTDLAVLTAAVRQLGRGTPPAGR
ncbi:MAG TPA: biopolymer transporter ExbB [Paracoccaceae bacterium]|nr:biopolymer transporter ExbB [Paracoccaceae bacterium]HMO70655.1 biopolymer transporter ExbB [Paracoccaceae bacterium]